MKPEKQRIAIAEACGWQFIADYCHGPEDPPEFTTVTPDGRHLCGYYPDYLNDLNAMHEAEKAAFKTGSQWSKYFGLLEGICYNSDTPNDPINSTAAQRAEAFLRAIGEWEDDA